MWWHNCLVLIVLLSLSSIANTEYNWISLLQKDDNFTNPCNSTYTCASPSLQCHTNCNTCVCADGYGLDNTGACKWQNSNVCSKCCYLKDNKLHCWKHICEDCYDLGKCFTTMQNPSVLWTATQVAISALIILGVMTIALISWKLYSKTRYRIQRYYFRRAIPRRHARGRVSTDSNGSTGTLQQMVAERMRDAPPPYCRTPLPPPGDTPPPYHLHLNAAYINTSFEIDINLPPPAYTPTSNEPATRMEPNDKAQVETTNSELVPTNVSNSETLHI